MFEIQRFNKSFKNYFLLFEMKLFINTNHMKQGCINKWIVHKNKIKIFSLPRHLHLHSSMYSFLLNLFAYWLYMFIVLPPYDQKQDNPIPLVEILGNFYLYLFIHILKKLWISIESISTIKSDKPGLPWGSQC